MSVVFDGLKVLSAPVVVETIQPLIVLHWL